MRIISGCPVGARKWHISKFPMLLHRKQRRPETRTALPRMKKNGIFGIFPAAPSAGKTGGETHPVSGKTEKEK